MFNNPGTEYYCCKMIICGFSAAWVMNQSFTLVNLYYECRVNMAWCIYNILRIYRSFYCFQTICPSLYSCSRVSRVFLSSIPFPQVFLDWTNASKVHASQAKWTPDTPVRSATLAYIIISEISHRSVISLVFQMLSIRGHSCPTARQSCPPECCEVRCQQTSHNCSHQTPVGFWRGSSFGDRTVPCGAPYFQPALQTGSASASQTEAYPIGHQGSRRRLIHRYHPPKYKPFALEDFVVSKVSFSSCIGSCGELQRAFVLEISSSSSQST